MSEGEERGCKYLTLKTSRYCAQLRTLGTSDPGWYYRGVPRNSTVDLYRYYRPRVGTTEGLAKTLQRTHIGTTDPRSVLLTKAERREKDKKTCSCRLGFPLTDLGHLLKHF
jgi:hypothetical protein